MVERLAVSEMAVGSSPTVPANIIIDTIMANVQKTASTGFPFLAILALIFITLKLCNVITWSWWWVLAPLWGPFVLGLGIVVVCLIISCIAASFTKK